MTPSRATLGPERSLVGPAISFVEPERELQWQQTEGDQSDQ